MIEALVIGLREGLEAALALGIILVYTKKIGRTDLNRYVYLGLAAAIIASILGAAYFQMLNLYPENEFMEGVIMSTGAVFVGSMVVWMMKTSKNIKGEIEQKIDAMAARKSLWLQGWGLLAFSFILVFREGIETVLFLTALSLRISGDPVLNLIGGVTGLLLAVVFGVMILKGMLRINLKIFFAGTGAILLILVATLLANAIHEFTEIGMLPSSTLEFTIIGLLVRDETSTLILMALVTLPILMIALDSWKPSSSSSAGASNGGTDETATQRRLRVSRDRQSRAWKVGAGAVAFIVIMSLGSIWAVAADEGYDPEPTAVTAEGGETITITLDDLKAELFSKYTYATGNKTVRFFAIHMAADGGGGGGTHKVALDACYICPSAGYIQAGEDLICKNCGAPINMGSVGLPGGCNPRVLNFKSDGSNISIGVKELLETAKHLG